ncbi:hypothetical protein CsSME_00035205 [Camellia sinensis var. sinensis]
MEKSSQSCWRRSLQDLAGAPPPKSEFIPLPFSFPPRFSKLHASMYLSLSLCNLFLSLSPSPFYETLDRNPLLRNCPFHLCELTGLVCKIRKNDLNRFRFFKFVSCVDSRYI